MVATASCPLSDRTVGEYAQDIWKVPLNFPPNETSNKRRRSETEQLLVGHVMLRAIDRYARGILSPDDVRILVAAFGDGTHPVQAFFTIRTREEFFFDAKVFLTRFRGSAHAGPAMVL